MVQHAGTDAARADRVCVLKGGEAVFSHTDVEAAAVCSAALFSGITSRDKLLDQAGGSAEDRAGTEGHTHATLQILVKDPRGRDKEVGKDAQARSSWRPAGRALISACLLARKHTVQA